MIGLRVSAVDLTHKDMGTLSIGHSARADAGAAYTGFTGTSIVNSTASGPGADGIMAEASDGSGMVARLGGHGAVNPSRENRLLYRTPNIAGMSFSASLNQGRGYSLGVGYSGPPASKDIGVVLGFGYRSQPNDGAGSTALGVSGGIQHKPSGLSINGVYNAYMPSGGDKHSLWGAELGWTGKLNDIGNTSVTVGYGKYSRGLENSTFYHFSVNQDVAAAATDVYVGVSYDTGSGMSPAIAGMMAVAGTDEVEAGTLAVAMINGPGDAEFHSDTTAEGLADKYQQGDEIDHADLQAPVDDTVYTFIAAIPATELVPATLGTSAVDPVPEAELPRDGVLALIFGVRVKF